MEVLATFTLAL
jgi:hypothetical protein